MARKHFVIDTNVLLHNPESIFDFADNNVVVTTTVLEELDAIKSQNRAVSRDARQAIRNLGSIVDECDPEVLGTQGVPRNAEGGRLIIPSIKATMELISGVSALTNDKRIIRDALILMKGLDSVDASAVETVVQNLANSSGPEQLETVFVSRDLNARLLARAHGLKAEDYKGALVAKEDDDFPTGFISVAREELFSTYRDSAKGRHFSFGRADLEGMLDQQLHPHQALVTEKEDELFIVSDVTAETVQCDLLPVSAVDDAFGILPQDYRQAAALNALLDDSIPLVVVTGGAGSGKTLLAIASSLEKVAEAKDPRARLYKKIIVARALEDLDKDIGALPGDEREKVTPWLGGIQDNIEFLMGYDPDGGSMSEEELSHTVNYVDRYFEYKSINYMRGRNIQNAIFILDESQNLTPSQMKTLITRAGQGCKVIVLGDIDQIDNPYLSRYSSGLTYLVESMKPSTSMAHFHLEGSPRSFLASESIKWLK